MLTYLKKTIKNNLVKPYWNVSQAFPYFRHKVFFPTNSIIFTRAVEDGVYESENLKIINTLVIPNTTVFDIGANIGLMAIPILTSNYSIKVISVEASPNTLPYLLKTHAASPRKKNWTIIDKAVSDKPGRISFQLTSKADGAYESILNTTRAEFTGSVEIECTTIDQIWINSGRPIVSFIKIDVEGADLLALKGGINCITSVKPSILMEWNKVNIRPFCLKNSDLMDFTRKINYSIFALPGLNKIHSLNDLALFAELTENFLLIPNHDDD